VPPLPAGFVALAGHAARSAGIAVCVAVPASANEGVWYELTVPGGRGALARAAGLDPTLEPWHAVADVARRLHAGPEGAALVPHVLSHLSAADDPAQDETVPLPLAPAVWEAQVFGREVEPRELLGAILAERDAAFLYRGLSCLDDPTLAFLAQQGDTLTRIHREHARVFALFAGAFRVRDGAVVVPGDSDSAVLWEGLVGQSRRRPAAFLLELLGRGGGSLAFLYDSVARLPEASQRFALGTTLADAAQRESRFRSLAEAFRRADPFWAEGRAGLTRPRVDAARVLLEVLVTPEGRLAPPSARSLWEAVLPAPVVPRGPAADAPADAAFLVETIALPDAEAAQRRLSLLHFAQRVFVSAGADPDLAEALRGFLRNPALMLSLERLGVRKAAVYAGAARRALQLAQPGRAGVALAQFQAGLALVERARFSGALDTRAGQELVPSLLAIEPVSGPRYETAIAAWLEGELLPALGLAEGDSAEAVLADALTGTGGAGPQTLWWEGRSFEADVAAASRARFAAVRAQQAGNSLDRVLDYCRSAAALATAPFEREALRAHALILEEVGQELAPAVRAAAMAPEDPRQVAVGLLRVLDADSGAEPPTRRLAQRALAVGEALLADTLVALVYAAQLRPGDVPLTAGELSRRHDFGVGSAGPGADEDPPWALPQQASGRPWRIQGSLLALDTALAPLALRRASDAMPQPAPNLGSADRLAFAQGVVFSNPFVLTDAQRDAVAAALSHGRVRVEGASTDVARADALAEELGLGALRRRLLAWLARREPRALLGFFSLSELHALGRPEAPVDAWGVADISRAGLFPRMPPPRPREDFEGVRGGLAARVPDLGLRLAAALAERRLPAALLPSLLSYAVQDLLDEAAPATGDDAEALARYAGSLSDERIDAYMAALAASGFLRASRDARGGEGR